MPKDLAMRPDLADSPLSATEVARRTAAAAALLEGYAPPAGFYDELLDEQQQPRPTWCDLLASLGELGAEGVEQREEQLRRIIQDNGITYNVYGDTSKAARPWTMDIVPRLLEHAECEFLEAGLGQRAQLFNLILQDVYGPQRLLKEGLLPPMVILGNPRFLRPCHRLLPEKVAHLHLFASDLARAPDGHWWVVNDRLDAASGLGYTLENRIISSRVLPEIFHRYGVRRLQPFLQRLTDSYERLAPKPLGEPLVVFLTPGPANETYFDQSYLARLLGFPLVEGADLTVRSNRVYLKTIAGMEPVDVIIRRLDSEWIDPLELRSDSLLGVPGLLGAVRAGNVTVSNAPGSGVLETAALPAFLPHLCRHFLGEDLRLPSVASWWCGQPRERDYVLAHLATLNIKPTFPSRAKKDYHGPSLSAAEREALRAAIRAAPEYFCAQETVAQSTSPVFDGGRLEPRHSLLRTYLIPSEGRFRMMPGGLARIARTSHSRSVSMQAGGESKDTWVLRGPDPSDDQGPVLASEGPVELRRDTDNLPSRTADNLFWLGRYIERTESLARVLRCVLRSLQEELGSRFHLGVLPIIGSFLNEEQERRLRVASEDAIDLRLANRYLDHMVHDLDCLGSLAQNFTHLRRISTAVKERLSLDAWALLRAGVEGAAPIARRADAYVDDPRLHQIENILTALAGFSGMVSENMTRGPSWTFLEVGRRIERSLALTNLTYSALIAPGAHEESTLAKL
ncbi:MAG: circularly permuted type 2 ATP-grasp protein, partial [Opitutales bacterium]